jgi:hypothetical protein
MNYVYEVLLIIGLVYANTIGVMLMVAIFGATAAVAITFFSR